MQVEEGKHTQLPRGENGPVWVSFGDCYCINIVEDKLHAEQSEATADSVHHDARSSEGRRCVSLLRYVVVECQDRTGQIQWRVEHIGNVVAECESGWFCGNLDAVTIRDGRRV